jgi:hypothetical protein
MSTYYFIVYNEMIFDRRGSGFRCAKGNVSAHSLCWLIDVDPSEAR